MPVRARWQWISLAIKTWKASWHAATGFPGNPTHHQESIFGCSEAQAPVPLITGYGIVHSHLSSPHVYSKIYTFPVSLLPVMLYYRFRNGAGFLKSSS